MLRRAAQGVRLRLVQNGGQRYPGGSGGGRRIDTPDKVIYGIMAASLAGYGAANGMLGEGIKLCRLVGCERLW